jgi:nicotinate phosphoribosyltransferase
MGTGVSVAAVWYLRETLDSNGFDKVRIVASSGFGPDKCRMFSFAKAPVDLIGTGSYLPQIWSETYATADIISYDGKPCVKSGREFLLRK